jgi:hypothetical protein
MCCYKHIDEILVLLNVKYYRGVIPVAQKQILLGNLYAASIVSGYKMCFLILQQRLLTAFHSSGPALGSGDAMLNKLCRPSWMAH